MGFLVAHPYINFALGVLAFLALRSTLSLVANIRYAKSTGLNYVVYPMDSNGLVMLVLMSLRRVQRAIARLPRDWQDYLNNCTYSTHWGVQGRMAQKHGGVFLAVAPNRITCHVSDADAITEIVGNRERFPKSSDAYASLRLYGPNIVATEGQQWAHHRKHTAPPFSERNYKLVWKESLEQAIDMVGTWEQTFDAATQEYKPDIHTNFMSLALHVISAAGFGIPMKFTHPESESEPPPKAESEQVDLFTDGNSAPHGFTFSYRKALHFISNNLVQHSLIIQFLPKWVPKTWFSYLRNHHFSHLDFARYLSAMVSKSQSNPGSGRSNLLDLLVTAEKVERERSGNDPTLHTRPGLSNLELMGNLFVFTLAGHETTAQTLHYALLMLALHPDVQHWAANDIDAALPPSLDPRDARYEDVFPQLIAPLCIMLETLRLFPIVPRIPKTSGKHGTTLTYDSRRINLRPMPVAIDATGAQRSTECFGPTAAEFDPTRWDARNTDSFLARNKGAPGLMAAGLEFPTVHKPVRGAFIAFSDGARACLGRKFGQVTFVAAMAVVLRGWTVEVAVKEGETREMAEKRAWRAVQGSRTTVSLGVGEEVDLALRRKV